MAELKLSCQRCLLAQSRSVNAQLDNTLIIDSRSDGAAAKSGHAGRDVQGDLVVLASPVVGAAELLEDDLLLSLPQRVCELVDCVNAPSLSYPIAQQERVSGAGSADAAERTGESPFAVLRKLVQKEIEPYNAPDNQGK